MDVLTTILAGIVGVLIPLMVGLIHDHRELKRQQTALAAAFAAHLTGIDIHTIRLRQDDTE